MLIRPAEPADHDAIWSILAPICAAGETFCVSTDGGRDAAFDYWFAGKGREVFVAEVEGAIVGTSYLRPNQGGGGAHVANAGYATAAASQGKGVARALLAHSLDAARARGFRAMQFNFVVATNTRAIATWEAAGFAIVGRLPRAFAHPRHGWVDALVMFREILISAARRRSAGPSIRANRVHTLCVEKIRSVSPLAGQKPDFAAARAWLYCTEISRLSGPRAAIRNSALPSPPRIGLSASPTTAHPDAREEVPHAGPGARDRPRGSRTIPPLPTRAGPTSNCGLISATSTAPGAPAPAPPAAPWRAR